MSKYLNVFFDIEMHRRQGKRVSYFCFTRAEKNEKSLYAQHSFRNLIKKLYKTPSGIILLPTPNRPLLLQLMMMTALVEEDRLARENEAIWKQEIFLPPSPLRFGHNFYVNHKVDLHFRLKKFLRRLLGWFGIKNLYIYYRKYVYRYS